MICNAFGADSGSITRTTFPSLATNIGSSPNISQAALTASFMGMAVSSASTPNPVPSAISFSVVASPPLVGSRMNRIPSPTSEISRVISPFKGAQSLTISASNCIPSLLESTAIPWSPMGPFISMRSPARISSIPSLIPSGMNPTPEVLIKIPSALPRSTTLVSPVTTSTPASAATFAIESSIFPRFSILNPSSRIRPQEMYLGTAPLTARSFIVPQTASFPISPPGKKMGLTTYESVVKANLMPLKLNMAESSSLCRMGFWSFLSIRSPISSCVSFPPLPCPRSTLFIESPHICSMPRRFPRMRPYMPPQASGECKLCRRGGSPSAP